jgi:putative hemolysin
MRPVIYVPENKRCNELMHQFKETNNSIAVVIDEYGGTAGIVTLEDLMEELFGEIDEFPLDSVAPIRQMNKNTYLVDAKETIENIFDQIGLDLPAGNYETIAGLVISQLGRIPEPGEEIGLKNCRIIIQKSTPKNIEQIRIIKKLQRKR